MDKIISNNYSVQSIKAPASKSLVQRVLLASTLSNKSIKINHIGYCDDVLHLKSVIKQLGAECVEKNDSISVTGLVNAVSTELNCGESGLGIRLTTPIASTFGKSFKISGKGSLLKRPLTQFTNFLPKMGVKINADGQLPLQISGQLKGGVYTIDGSLSSQYISGLLMALPLCTEDSILHVKSPTSIPYIDITLSVLDFFNIKIRNENYTTFHIKGRQHYLPKNTEFNIEGDWSGSSFWIVYGLLKGKIEIENLKQDSTQADKAILEVVKLVGSDYEWKNNVLTIIKKSLNPFVFDATNCPDLFPALVTLAAGIKGNSTIKGVNRLKHKESDRGLVLQAEFKKLGLTIDIAGDEMTIYGKGQLNSSIIDSNNDHRIAMTCAIASILTKKGITITNAESVNKSYPEFWNLFNQQ